MEKILLKKSGMFLKFMTGILLIAAAVLFPQIIHVIGKWSHSGNMLGTIILPMHFAVLISGLILGPIAGGMIGVFSPLVSYLLTGMPAVDQLLLMSIELAVYGISCGLISKKKLPIAVKIMIAQICGRIVKFLIAFLITLTLPDISIDLGKLAATFLTGLPGIVMQILLIPCLFNIFKGFTKYYE